MSFTAAVPPFSSRCGTRPASFTHSLRSYDAVMLALADEAATRAGTARHLATFDSHFLSVDGLHVWGLTR
jgi:predicted nucleic acid-binding protein